MVDTQTYNYEFIDGLVQDCSNSSALAMALLQPFAEPSIHTSLICFVCLIWHESDCVTHYQIQLLSNNNAYYMMTSSNGNIFRVTGLNPDNRFAKYHLRQNCITVH